MELKVKTPRGCGLPEGVGASGITALFKGWAANIVLH